MIEKILPTEDNNEIDKYAIILKSSSETTKAGGEEGGEGEEGKKGGEREKEKMIGLVGTNRLSEQGMEVGYCLNREYWGKGYATEAFSSFLSHYWTLPGIFSFPYNLFFLLSTLIPTEENKNK